MNTTIIYPTSLISGIYFVVPVDLCYPGKWT